jgi:hypothetical protein
MLRSFTEEYIAVTNLGKRRLGPFALPKVFRFAAYKEAPGPMAQLNYSGWFKLDIPLANCYNTAAGIGVAARKADVDTRRKGWPWWLLICVPVALFGAFFLLEPAAALLMKHAVPNNKAAIATATNRGPSAVASPVVASPSQVRTTKPVAFFPASVDKPAYAGPVTNDSVWFGGMTKSGAFACMYLSDGRKLPVPGNDIRWITEGGCRVGDEIFLAKPGFDAWRARVDGRGAGGLVSSKRRVANAD